MMEYGIRMQFGADYIGILNFPVRQIVNQFLHSLRLFVEIHHCLRNIHEMMQLFKDSRPHQAGHKILVPVNFLYLFDIRRPLLIGIIQSRSMHVIPPLCDVLQNQMLFIMHREFSGQAFRPGKSDSPRILRVDNPRLQDWSVMQIKERASIDNFQEFILIHKAVRVASVYCLQKILFNC